MKDSRCCSLEKEFLICSNSSFRKLGEQILLLEFTYTINLCSQTIPFLFML